MVRTSGGIRISAGKSSKKGGGGGGGGGAGGSSRLAPSTPSGKSSSSRGSSRLPPIPHCEAPSWQKPITNFFNVGAGSSKEETLTEEKPESSGEVNKENDSSSINKNDDLDNEFALDEDEDEEDSNDISGVEPLEKSDAENNKS